MQSRGWSLGRLLWIVTTAACLVTPALAQTGGLKIVVFEVLDDGRQELLPGAVVQLSEPDGKLAPLVVTTDVNGEALFPIVPVGRTYQVEISMPGYAAMRLTEVQVVANEVRTIQAALNPEISETVKVIGRRQVVELSEGATSTTEISAEAFADLPIFGREYQNALSLAAGVQDTDGDGNPNVHGSREQDFQMTVGGVSNVDPLTGERMSSINPDAIEEIEVIDSGADASFGGAIGGFGRISYKSGGNAFEGSFTLYFRDSTFDNDAAGGRDPLDYQVFRPAFYLSGPIVKDKAWFVTSHELVRVDVPIDLIGGADFVQKQRGLRNLDQITWQVTPKDKLQLQYGSDPFTVEPAAVSSTTPPESGVTFSAGGPTVSLKWTNQFSGDMFFESLVAFQNVKNQFAPYQEDVRNSCIPDRDSELGELLTSYCVNRSLGLVSGTFNQTQKDRRRRWTYSFKGEKYIPEFLGGDHRIVFGMQLERATYVRDVNYRTQLLLQDLPGIPTTNPRIPDSIVEQSIFFPPSQSSESRGNFYAAYISDSFNVRQNLNVTFGVRLSREELASDGFAPVDVEAERADYDQRVAQCIADGGIPRVCAIRNLNAFTAHPIDNPALYPRGCTTAPNPRRCQDLLGAAQGGELRFREPERFTIDNWDIAPRLSVSWDPWNDTKTKVSGSWGRYYGSTFLAPLVNELGPDFFSDRFAIDTFGFKQTLGFETGFTITEVDRNLKRQYSDEWTLRFEREVAPETSVIARYVNRRYRNQFQDIDVNRRAVYYDELLNNRPVLFNSFARCDRIGEFADCTGDLQLLGVSDPEFGRAGELIPVPDGFADVELVSPMFSSVYLLGNFNESEYQAYILELVRRFYRNWEFRASYTWSTSFGQADTYGSALGDDVTNQDDERGPLSTDQRHVLTLFGRVFIPRWGGYRVGGVLQYESGLPYSITEQRSVLDLPTELTGLDLGRRDPASVARGYTVLRFLFPTGARNDHRNQPFWTLNLNFQKEFEIKDVRASVQLNIYNALNDRTLQIFGIRRVTFGADPRTGEIESFERPIAIRRFGRQFELLFRANF